MAQTYISLTFFDEKGERSTRQVYLPNSATLAQATAFAGTLVDAIDPLVTGALDSISITFALTDGFSLTNFVGSDVQEMGRFAFNTAAGFVSAITLPTIVESIFNLGSKTIDLSNTAVDTFVALMEDGDGFIAPVDAHGDDIGLLATAREAWGKYRP
jgi:hypothetical protein